MADAMDDDTITHEAMVVLPSWWGGACDRRFNESKLRPMRAGWRDAGCTSKVRRIPDGYLIEVSGPVSPVLDAVRDINDFRNMVQYIIAMTPAIEKLAEHVEPVFADGHEVAFVCSRGHIFGAVGELARQMHEKCGAPRCVDCGDKTFAIKRSE